MIITLLGLDNFAQQQRLRQLVTKPTLQLFGVDGLTPWMQELGQSDLFGQTNTLVGQHLFEDLSAADRKMLAQHLQTSNIIAAEQKVIILVNKEAIPKDPLSEVLQQGKIESFPLPSPGQISRWIQEEANKVGLKLEKSLIPTIIENFSGNRFAIQTELAKWALHQPAVITANMESQIVFIGAETEAFGLSENWSQKNLGSSLDQLQQLLANQQAPQALIALLERQARLLYLCLAVQQGTSNQSLAQQLGIAPFIATKLTIAAKKWTRTSLKKSLENLFQLDLDIKTGKIDAEIGLSLWIVESLL